MKKSIVLLTDNHFHWLQSSKRIVQQCHALFKESIDFNIITEKENAQLLERFFSKFSNVSFLLLDKDRYPLNYKHPSLRKFMIFESDLLDKYDQILYLDSDMIVKQNFEEIFHETNFDFGFTFHRKIKDFQKLLYGKHCVSEKYLNSDLPNGGFILIHANKEIISAWKELKKSQWIYQQDLTSDRGIWNQLAFDFKIKKFSHLIYDFPLRLLTKVSQTKRKDFYYQKYFEKAKIIHCNQEKPWSQNFLSGNEWNIKKRRELKNV